jgi:hypothetical protein
METPPPVQEPPPPAPTTSVAARMLNVFTVPGEAFQEVAASAPSVANWLTPAVLLILVSWVGTWLVFSQESFQHQLTEYTDQAIQKRLEKAHVPKEQADQAREMGQKIARISSTVGAYAGTLVIALASPFMWGLFLWLAGTKALKANFSYMKAVEVVGLGNTLAVLEALVQTLLILGLGSLFATPSLGLAVKDFDPQNPTHAAMAVVNPFTFWALAIRSVGLGKLCGVTFAHSAVWVFGIWATYTVLRLGLGFATHAAFGG